MTTTRRVIASATLLLLAVLAWALVAPPSLGGQFGYVRTHGSSMLPRVRTGDLVVVHRSDGYRIGDVVAYRSATLRTVILHRIVDVDPGTGHFITKGDNNSFRDPDRPRPSEVLGRTALQIPGAGDLLERATRPRTLIAFAVLAMFFAAASRRPSPRRTPMTVVPHSARRHRYSLVQVGAAVTLLVVLAAVLFAIPTKRTGTRHVAGQRTVSWSYGAAVPVSATYPAGRITTGDPVFIRLARNLTVTASDSTTGSIPASAVTASVENSSGWRSALPLKAVAGGAQLDLHAMRALLGKVARETATASGNAAKVTISASSGGASALLVMSYDGAELRTEPAGLTSVSKTDRVESTLVPILIGRGRAALRLSSLRWILVALAMSAAAAAYLRRRRDSHETAVPRGAIEATAVAIPADRVVIDVVSAAALLALSKRCERPIVHYRNATTTVLLLDDGTNIYRHADPAGARELRHARTA